MTSYQTSNGRTILTSMLSPPSDFLNITSATEASSGFYLLGYDNFPVRNLRVAGIFHRSVAGHQEDFVLGVLSVMLIAALTEIVHVILMRSRRTPTSSGVSRSGLHAAYMLDEVTHFRNVWRLFSTCRTRRPQHPHTSRIVGVLNSQPRQLERSRGWNSLTIITVGVMLLAAEVFAVYLTQPIRLYTTRDQYNLRGVQPAGTSSYMAFRIDKKIANKTCVSPSMANSIQSREFSISACIIRNYSMALSEDDAESDVVEVSSWFHEAGSDHRVRFWNEDSGKQAGGEHVIRTRASIMQSDRGVTRGLMFENRDSSRNNYAHTRYMQKYMVYSALEWSCNQDFETRECNDLAEGVQDFSSETKRRDIALWEMNEEVGNDGDDGGGREFETKVKAVEGIVTKYKVKLKRPFFAIQSALRVLGTSAVIEEVQERTEYMSLKDGTKENGIDALLSEEGRIAGVVLLAILFVSLLVLLCILRMFLKPISLAEIARRSVEEMDEMENEFQLSEEGYVSAGAAGGAAWGMAGSSADRGVWHKTEMDIVEAEMEEYRTGFSSEDGLEARNGEDAEGWRRRWWRRRWWRTNDPFAKDAETSIFEFPS